MEIWMKKSGNIAFMGIMLGLTMALSVVEGLMPPLPFLPPNARLGLSNIITMYCVFFVGNRQALLLAALKSGFVLLTRGPVAGLLSFSGGMLSVAVVILLVFFLGARLSYTAASVSGAVAHNIGQLAAATFVTGSGLIFYYLPALIVSGVVMGTVTGVTLKLLIPVFEKTFKAVTKR